MVTQKIRKSPSESATLYKLKYKKIGNDGNMWIVEQDKNGRHRWNKLEDTKTATRRLLVVEPQNYTTVTYLFENTDLVSEGYFASENYETDSSLVNNNMAVMTGTGGDL
jgi:hypothetical protein